MFGYLTAYKDKLSEEDKELYQAYYCGLCRNLQKRHSKKSALILAYDPVFLALLYNGLYEEPEERESRYCLHKAEKVPLIRTETLNYAADVNLLLAYQNYMDKVHDSGSKKALRAVRFLKREYRETAEQYPRQTRALEEYMRLLHECEARESDNPDEAANLTGKMCEEVFLMKEDEFEKYLRPLFFYLGKYVYLTDAFCDLEDDMKTGAYNPYRTLYHRENAEQMILMHLESGMGEAAASFEKLPIFRHREILRNILYAGVWLGYQKAVKERKEKEN